jgi:protoheme IX farnesyltransferase
MQVTHSSEVTRSLSATWKDYLQLTKPLDVLLIALVAMTALMIAGETLPPFSVLIWTTVGSILAAAGAGALNSYLDRDIEAVMSSTRNRPLPAQRLEPRQAYRFGISLAVLSFFVMLLGVNPLTALLSLGSIVVYVVLYTYWLKRRSMHNILMAGAAWAIPALVGWSGSTGTLSIAALSLFAILFYWTPIYYWSQGLVRPTDYTKAGLPTLPVIKGGLTTRKQIVYYSILMILLTLLPAAIGLADFIYAEAALLLGGLLVFNAFELFRRPSVSGASRLHKYTLIYLALIFVAMMLDRTIL